MAKERRIAIYTFALGGDVSDAKYKELEAMSLDTGGKCYRGSQDDLAGYTGIMLDETVDYATDSNEDGISDPCSGEERREVDPRTLAIFSALSYEDGTEAMRRSGFYKEIVGSPPEERGETYYFLDGASVKPGGSDDYVRDWVVAEYENIDVPPLIGARFSATVYAHGDDIVLAYRGTDEKSEWNNDGLGYFANYTLEEPHALLAALRVAWKYYAAGKRVHITGHSLGGYLAQVGAAELIRSGCADKLRRCEYFNGMGLDYGRMSPRLPDQYQHASERELLSGWGARTGALSCTASLETPSRCWASIRVRPGYTSPLMSASGTIRASIMARATGHSRPRHWLWWWGPSPFLRLSSTGSAGEGVS